MINFSTNIENPVNMLSSNVCFCVCGSVTTITQNCVHRSSPNCVCRWR